MNKKIVAILSSACLLGVTGCAANQNDNATNMGMTNDYAPITRVNYNNYNENGQFEMNRQHITNHISAANHVERLDEVDEARVIMQGNNAYVAVKLTQHTNNNTDYGNAVRNNSATNSGTVGTSRGMANEYNNVGFNTRHSKTANNTERHNGTAMGERVNETPTGNNPATTRPGLGNNTNFTTNVDSNNRNTRATGNTTQMSTQLEQKIKNQVRSAYQNVDEVFVSVDSDFYKQMTNYTNTLENGQNRDGMDDDFTETIRDFFNR